MEKDQEKLNLQEEQGEEFSQEEVDEFKVETLLIEDLKTIDWIKDGDYLEDVRESLEEARGETRESEYVVLNNEDGIPVALGAISYEGHSRQAVISHIKKDKEFRGFRLKARVVEALEERARERGFQEVLVTIESGDSKELRRYEGLGYILEGREEVMENEEGESRGMVLMKKNLGDRGNE